MALEKLKDIEYKILSKAVRPEDKPVGETTKDKMLLAGLGAIMGLAGGTIVPVLLRSPLTKRSIIGSTLAGGVSGYTAPLLHNLILKQKQNKFLEDKAKKEFKEIEEIEEGVRRGVELFPRFSKRAKLLSPIFKGIGGGIKGAGKAYWRGLMPTPKVVRGGRKVRPFGKALWGLGVKGATGVGLYGGYKAMMGRRRLSGRNYVTFLRNNILAGNIKPEELSQEDLIAVRRLGMR